MTMYRSFYGLRERPFDLTSDPRYLCLTANHREALSMLRYGLQSRKGLALLIGEAGTGKTTLVRAALQEVQTQHGSVVFLSNPTLTRSEFVEYLAQGFGLGDRAAGSKTRFLLDLEQLLIERHQKGALTALIVDEAQSLSDELLEEIRLLANIETATDKLLAVVLAGQPELGERLNQGGLRQLKQRIGLRCVLDPLDVAETAAYIVRRVSVAGGTAQELFSREAVQEIHKQSGGVPRTISVICDNVLVSGFAIREKPVGVRTVQEVCRDFELLTEEPAYGQDDASRPDPLESDLTPTASSALPRRNPLRPPGEAAPSGAVPARHTFSLSGLRERFFS